MAIDTETKRRSVHGYTNSPVYPVPDSTIGASDRAHVAWIYSGLTYTVQATGVPSLYCTPLLLDFYITDTDLDFHLAPLEIALNEPILLNAFVQSQELDFYIPPLRIECD